MFEPGHTRKCKECGVSISFVEGESGKAIPLQRIRNVYGITQLGKPKAKPIRPPNENGFWVSHFETCTNPSRFSKGKKSDEEQNPDREQRP